MSAAAAPPAVSKEQAAALIRFVNSNLIVRQLQTVLKLEKQPTSGLKYMLQERLIDYIEGIVRAGKVCSFERVKNLVYSTELSHPSTGSASSPSNRYLHGHSPAPTGRASGLPAVPHPYGGPFGPPRILFKESPFCTILAPLSDHARCPTMSAHRNQVTTIVALTPQHAQQLSEKSYRCMVFCAAIETLIGFTRDTDVLFPQQVEVRVNSAAVSGLNLRGLKNRPGSTRPADITDKLIIRANYRNEVSLTYAQTQKEFAFIVNLVKVATSDDLVERLLVGNSISEETVVADMIKNNQDTDLIATSTVMSLRCPLSTQRVQIPVRSLFCTHMQCFDARSFLQLQEQVPTWVCPACNKSITFKHLAIDRYFENILENTNPHVLSVTIDENGAWSVAAEASCKSPLPDSSNDGRGNPAERAVVDLENGSSPRTGSSPAATTPASSNHTREGSLSVGRISNKRPISHVIDLTLSDDDEQPRSAKRTPALPTPPSAGSGSGYSTLYSQFLQ